MSDDSTRPAGHCPACGRRLAPAAAGGLCAACLLGAGIETLTTSSIEDMPTMSSAGGVAAGGTNAPRLSEGQAWGAYRIGRLLGRGGMGEVYEAEHVESGRRVALKVLRGRLQHGDDRARFLREGQLAASISHPHTVYIFGSDEIAGTPVIAMELLPGGTLKDRVAAEGPLAPADAVAAVLDIVGGLDAAQAAGILHRDIKPSNCFVDRDRTVKVGDFGLSISTLARDVHLDVATSGFEGTPQFAPPEQLRGEPLDVRADIYAVGATLYYLLTGQPPFEAQDLRELVARATSEPARSPRLLRPDIPKPLAAIVLQCLAKAPSQRPASYAALAEMLRPFLAQAHSPATLSVRFVAGVADAVVLLVPTTVWSLAASDPLTGTAEASAMASMWASAVSVLYYLVLEGRWNASVGKRLFGLRIVSVDGRRAPFLRVAARTGIYFLVPNLPVGLLLLSGAVTAELANAIRVPIALSLIGLLFLATARRGNGWAALHDALTGTRVVAHQAAPIASFAAARDLAPELALPAASTPQRYGPFTAVSAPVETGDGQLVVAFDPVLRRQVWIHRVRPGTSPVSMARRDVSRIGRLRWLTGRRASLENWDAYEAPDGGPLRTDRPEVTWTQLKVGLLGLGAELTAAEKDGTVPVLRLDRLWVRNDGRPVLLDFALPWRESRGDGGPAREDVPQRDLTPAGLLTTLTTGQLSALAARVGPASMPLSAHRLLDRWTTKEPPNLADATTALAVAAAAHDRVRARRRSVPMALAGVPVGVALLMAALVLPYLYRFATNPQTAEILSVLSVLQNPTPAPNSRLRDPDVRTAIERYLVGRHRDVLRDEQFWGMAAMQYDAMRRLRPVADAALARHPAVSADDLARATALIEPERQRWARGVRAQSSDMLNVAGIITSVLLAGTMSISIAACLLSAALVPGGVVTRQLGYAVVSREGREIGRAWSVLRATVAWLPGFVWLGYLAASPKIQGFVPTPPAPLLGIGLVLTVLAIGVTWTLWRPTRGPHDRVVGTWVVPR